MHQNKAMAGLPAGSRPSAGTILVVTGRWKHPLELTMDQKTAEEEAQALRARVQALEERLAEAERCSEEQSSK